MANFFELLGFSSDEMADTMPERIVQAFHDRGKDGVRVLMYEEMSKRLECPLHIHAAALDGSIAESPDVYGHEQPGEPMKLIREVTDLYRRFGEPASPEASPDPPSTAVTGSGRKRGTLGGSSKSGAGGGSNTGGGLGGDAWEKRFQDLAAFVAKYGYRPRRTAELDSERHLHYWMGQQQRKLGHSELSRDQADRLEAVLQATKGKKAETTRRTAGSSSRQRAGGGAAYDSGEGDEDGYN